MGQPAVSFADDSTVFNFATLRPFRVQTLIYIFNVLTTNVYSEMNTAKMAETAVIAAQK